MRGGRCRVVGAVACALIAAGTMLGGSASGQTGPGLGGYQGSAGAAGVRAYYNPEGLLPITAIVNLGAPDALATVTTGPVTFARASVADPGDILANPDAVLALAFPGYPQGSIPPYPYRVTATSGFGEPDATSEPAPGLRATVHADQRGSSAAAATPAADVPAVASVGSMAAEATTSVTDDAVTVRARSRVSRFSLLGVFTVDSITSDATATSGGGPPALTGATKLSGASVLGRPVTVDADGVHLAPGSPPLPGLGGLGLPGGTLDEQLRAAGIRITLARPVRQEGESAGQLAAPGLRIELELSNRTFPLLTQLAEAVPSLGSPVPGAPSPDDVVELAKARHLTVIEVGGASVSLSARPAAPAGDGLVPPASDARELPSLPEPALFVGGDDVSAPPSDAPSATAPSVPAVRGAPGRPAAASLGAGVGALALAALLLQPLAGARIARGVGALLGGDDTDGCPLEEAGP